MAAKTDQDLKKKLKDKKSRSIRKLRKEAPVRLSSDGGIEFDTDSAAIHCLTSSTDDYQNAGTIDFNLAQIVVCQSECLGVKFGTNLFHFSRMDCFHDTSRPISSRCFWRRATHG